MVTVEQLGLPESISLYAFSLGCSRRNTSHAACSCLAALNRCLGLCLPCRQQDAQLEDIEAAVTRLGRVGLTIHEELESQGQMLDELEEDVDTTHSRLRATQKKVSVWTAVAW